ncbi:MAG: anhydro-N-acetylmuramic acid kinase [Planctomycetota bacterium]|jgi:1,6-anhydro-N-acetylmuramate kinase
MPDADSPTRFVIGVMTGTSLDGIDVATAAIRGAGLDMRARLIRHGSADLGPLAGDLRRAADQEPLTAEALAGLALALGERYADAIAGAAEGLDHISLIAVHGQTVVHRPPVSWQLINPAPVALRFNCPVVFDLRQADLAAGGQGAPITPAADWVLFGDAATRRAVVNLGGFCNVTVLGDDAGEPLGGVRGFDVCVCNQLLDEAARRALDAPYDEGGRAAQHGEAQDYAVKELLEILTGQRTACRSLGTGDEARSWMAAYAERLLPEDLAATVVEAVASSITGALADHDVDEIVVAGGGARNRALLDALRRRAGCALVVSDELGVPLQAREALAMAVLGALCADRVPITLPRVTGCAEPAPLAGTWCLPTGTM